MIRGEPAIGRDQSREPRLYSVEPYGVLTMKQSYFCGQGSEAAGPFS
jgi:20S proteasome alpha/beta subunit